MPFKDILVHVDSSKRCPERVKAAANLALASDAKLVGLFLREPPRLPAFVVAEWGAQMLEYHNRFIEEKAAIAKDIFLKACKEIGVEGEWREAKGPALDVLSMHARYIDLAVMGQTDTDDEESLENQGFAEEVILNAGRPVLMIPYAGSFNKIGQKIMVAWNGSRESTRAVADAMPFLVKAKEVLVMVANPSKGTQGHGDVPGADICLHLARHGVKAVAQHVVARDIDVGNLLLSRASDEDIDMIVMGAYGRSRLRELVLGGATNHIMAHMTVPILFSH